MSRLKGYCGMNLAFFDLETTGLDVLFREQYISLACVLTDDKGNEVDRFYEYCSIDQKNGYKWSDQAAKIHKLDKGFIARQQHIEKLANNLGRFLMKNGERYHFIEHSLRPFDRVAIESRYFLMDKLYHFRKICPPHLYLSTIDLAKMRSIKGSKSLANLCKTLDLSDFNHHDALEDAIACKSVFFKLDGVNYLSSEEFKLSNLSEAD